MKRGSVRRILWPTDLSAAARAALPEVIRVAKLEHAQVVVFHVLPAIVYPVPELSSGLWEQAYEATREHATKALRALAAELERHHIATETVVAKGVPFYQIVWTAKRLKCDLIVLATHGQTGLRHVFLGSVAENVVRHAPCPVLTVRSVRRSRSHRAA